MSGGRGQSASPCRLGLIIAAVLRIAVCRSCKFTRTDLNGLGRITRRVKERLEAVSIAVKISGNQRRLSAGRSAGDVNV